VHRADEFAPLKNATGADSPDTVRRLQLDRAIRWLRAVGRDVPNDSIVEIRPSFALNAEELRGKLPRNWQYSGPIVLG